MSADFATQLPGQRRMDIELLRTMSEPLDPWHDPPYKVPPSPSLLDKTQAVMDDMEADAAAQRESAMRAIHRPPRGDVRLQSPLVTPERIEGSLVSLIG
ncbi:MAG TPA: hypothetical protein VE028_06545 [Nitratidesulfovibrio sp.]|nr:hypothetical protein [Nitratidesulfovibrio sp.]